LGTTGIDAFPKLKNFELKMHSMIGNTYVRESTCSTMNQVKSKNRNRMADAILYDRLRLATTDTAGIEKGTMVSVVA